LSGSFKLREIARPQVQALIDRKLDQDYSKSSLRLIRAVLSGIVGEAVDDDIIKVNVALSASVRKDSAGAFSCPKMSRSDIT
jgi:hypothetical protein